MLDFPASYVSLGECTTPICSFGRIPMVKISCDFRQKLPKRSDPKNVGIQDLSSQTYNGNVTQTNSYDWLGFKITEKSTRTQTDHNSNFFRAMNHFAHQARKITLWSSQNIWNQQQNRVRGLHEPQEQQTPQSYIRHWQTHSWGQLFLKWMGLPLIYMETKNCQHNSFVHVYSNSDF